VKPTKEYNWKFNRVNSKGEVIFKHKTNESLDEVVKFLEEKNINFEVKEGARMLWIYFKDNKFSYYYTTGRWSPFIYKSNPKKHYHSTGIEDFYNRFLLKSKPRKDGRKFKFKKPSDFFQLLFCNSNSGPEDVRYINGRACVYWTEGMWISEYGIEEDEQRDYQK
tara:strand:+ start:2244 stop:2738 length:495 start_codon:yes stop_codon:yes gene_type:complete